MKSWVPNSIKFPFWWLIKSPQRDFGWYTLKNDLLSLGVYFKAHLFSPKLKSISICVGIFNRQETFLKNFIPSLANCSQIDKIELSIVVCGREGAIEFEKRIREVYKGKLVIQFIDDPFTRSSTLNKAVLQSNNELLFLCDADFSIPENIVSLCSGYTQNNACWFPIVFYLYKNKPASYSTKNGEWMLWGGKGLVAISRIQFDKLGGLSEQFITWGGEDEDFWIRAYKEGFLVLRTRERGLLHHWHPSLNAKYKKLEELTDLGIL